MREVEGSSVAAIAIPLAPIVAQKFGRSIAEATFLALALAFTFAPFSILLPVPFRSIFVNLPFSSLTGWISCSMASNSASVASYLARARLVVSIHDREARVSFLSALFIHFLYNHCHDFFLCFLDGFGR